jgi:hypothetical protein
MTQGRSLQMEDILSYLLGPLPWALSTPDGMLRKTNKAALATVLQKNVSVAESLPDNSASVIDGINLVQKLTSDHDKDFLEMLQTHYFPWILELG